MRLEGKRCLVTGAASGVGDRLARLLGSEGAAVVSLDQVAPSAPVEEHIEVDLADQRSIDAALSRLRGPWDAVCNVAGVDGDVCPARVFAVNFLAARHLCEAFVRRLRRGGAIVNVASTSSHEWPQHVAMLHTLLATADFTSGAEWFAGHAASRPAEPLSQEALVAYTKTRGPQLIPAGLRMNAVSPGPVDTPMLADFRRNMGSAYVDEATRLMGRPLAAEQIARVVAFLVSDDSAPVNGHNVIADGGLLGLRR